MKINNRLKMLAVMYMILICFTACGSNDKESHKESSSKISTVTESESELMTDEQHTTETIEEEENKAEINTTLNIESKETEKTTEQKTTQEKTTEQKTSENNAGAETESTTKNNVEETSTVHTHKWNEATCQKPKTCMTCNKTEGKANEHVYEGIKCKYCKQTHDKVLITDKEYRTQVITSEESLYTVTIIFTKDNKAQHIYKFYTNDENNEDIIDDNTIVIDGTKYYCVGSGREELEYTVAEKEISIFYMDGTKKNIIKKLTVMPDGSLKVSSSDGNMYIIDTLFN